MHFTNLIRRCFSRLIIGLSIAYFSQVALAADKVTFQLDWLPGGDKAPLYVGIQQGFFAAQNIQVKISHGRGSTDAISKIATGTADIGLSDLVALMLAKSEQTIPVSAVYSVFSEAPHAFFVLEGSGISSVKDVANKKVATSPFTSSNVFLPLLLSVNQVPPNSVRVIKTDPGALNPMLLTGNADVVISWITDTEKYRLQAKSANKKLQVLPWYDAGLEFYSTAIIANDRFLKQRPDVAKRFINAYSQAIDFTWKNPYKSAQMVSDLVPEVEAKSAAETIKSISGLVYNQASEKHGVGVFDPERLSVTWQWTARAQQRKVEAFDPESAINRNFMPGE